MSAPITSRRKAGNYFTGLFLVGLAILSFTNTWWPGILLVIGLPLALRQYLRGRIYDMCVSLVIFVGLFVLYWVGWENVLENVLVLPVLLFLGGMFILFREYTQPMQRYGVEEVEDAREELRDAEDSE